MSGIHNQWDEALQPPTYEDLDGILEMQSFSSPVYQDPSQNLNSVDLSHLLLAGPDNYCPSHVSSIPGDVFAAANLSSEGGIAVNSLGPMEMSS